MLLTLKSLINAIYIRIAGVTGDASANRDIVDNLAIGVDTARAGAWVLAF